MPESFGRSSKRGPAAQGGTIVLIRAGFRIAIRSEAEMPLLCALSPHPHAVRPVLGTGAVRSDPPVPIETYRDAFDNEISRLTAPPGAITLVSDFVVDQDGAPDEVNRAARQQPVADLPTEILRFLIPSRYCESDLLATEAWSRFGATAEGWARVQAICDFVHGHIEFGYQYGRPTKSAVDVLREGNGVCRDFAHLAVALCRAMNIPARYCSGYLPDIGVPYGGPMDFSAWFEVWLDGRWYTFDARFNTPRIGRILMVRGRDATDVAMITSFGAHAIERFEVWAEELPADLELPALAALLAIPGRDRPSPAGRPSGP
jgi:transglutaminase-like putative cysteine protease